MTPFAIGSAGSFWTGEAMVDAVTESRWSVEDFGGSTKHHGLYVLPSTSPRGLACGVAWYLGMESP